jgi:hypothetical protein
MGKPLNLKKQLLRTVPTALRHWLIRQSFHLPESPPAEITVRTATTQDELEQAYRVLQLSYEEMGYATKEPSGLRLTKYFALPTTSTLIVCWKNQVVGTMSVIRDGPFGTPVGEIFELGPLKKRGWQLAEVSSLAIDPDFRRHRGQILFPLCKYLYDYVRFYQQVDAIVIAVHPRWRDFYEALLMFQPLKQRMIPNYDFANGAPAVGLYLPLKQSQEDFRSYFSHRAQSQDLHRYMVVDSALHATFPSRAYFKSQDPVLNAEMLKYFFVQKKPILNSLSGWERHFLREQYGTADAVKLFSSLWGPAEAPLRERRYNALLNARIDFQRLQVLNTSRLGLLVRTDFDLPAESTLAVLVNKTEMARLRVAKAWGDSKLGLWGLTIKDSDSHWQRYLNYLEDDMNQVPLLRVAQSG